MKRKLSLLLTFFVFCVNGFSQKEKLQQLISLRDLDEDFIKNKILERINNERAALFVDELIFDTILQKASEDQSVFMAYYDNLTLLQPKRKKTTEDRIVFYGGSPFGKEFLYLYHFNKGKETKTYQHCINLVTQSWLNSKRISKIILDPKFLFTGISLQPNIDSTEFYFSIVLGNYKSLVSSKDKVEQLEFSLSDKRYGLKPYDPKICRKIDAEKNLSRLQDGIVKEGNLIYFETDDYKQFRKLFREGGGNGIALDVVQKKQYLTEGPNIVDYSKLWKGTLYRPIWAFDLSESNTYKGKEGRYKLKSPIAMLENKYGDKVEYNLLLIREKHVCAEINTAYNFGLNKYQSNLVSFLADTITINAQFDYDPLNDNTELVFKIPFEKNKGVYERSDIEPIIKSLNEPNFIINKVDIEAFSSIEGDDDNNEKLQINRALSIEKALKDFISINPNIDQANIVTGENWTGFCQDVVGTNFEYLSKMTLEEAKSVIKKEKIDAEFEKILSKQRYANVKLGVTFILKGKEEEKYVLQEFNESVRDNDKIKALAIQKYIFKKLLSRDYSLESALGQEIPKTTEFAGLKMNQIWLLNYFKKLENSICDDIKKLYVFRPDNMYIHFNDVLCDFQNLDFQNIIQAQKVQNRIEGLYKTNLPESTIDALYIEYLYKMIKNIDPTSDAVDTYLGKMKDVIDIEEITNISAYNLSLIFIEYEDYGYAIQLLEPFLDNKSVNESILFTYIGLCTRYKYKVTSHKFYKAIEKVLDVNPDKLVHWFKTGQISVQVLENTKVKAIIIDKLKNII